MWMLLCWNYNNDLNAQKLSTMNLEMGSQYILHTSPWHTFKTTTKLHINTFFICANLMIEWTNSNKVKMQANPTKILRSHRYS